MHNCYDDPNWNDEALKKCRYQGDWFMCNLCCNEEICNTLKPATSPKMTNFVQELMAAIDEGERRRMESYNRIAFSPGWIF